jgi:hypothetical protein
MPAVERDQQASCLWVWAVGAGSEVRHRGDDLAPDHLQRGDPICIRHRDQDGRVRPGRALEQLRRVERALESGVLAPVGLGVDR